MIISLVNTISSFTSGSLESFDPCVVPHPKEFEYYRNNIFLIMVYISSLMIFSTFSNIGQHLHPHMDGDQPTPPIWVVDPLSSHDLIDNFFTLDNAIFDIITSIYNPKDEVMRLSPVLS